MAGAIALAGWVYARRELPIPGRRGLAALRSGSLVLVAVLLWNPELPVAVSGESGAVPWVLVDGSPSMGATLAAGGTAWEAAGRFVEGAEGRIATFGGSGLEPGMPVAPGGLDSRLAPALDRAFEAGATEVTVVTDLRLTDPAAVAARLARAPVLVRFENVGPAGANAGIDRFDAPRVAGAGDSITLEIGVFVTPSADPAGSAEDSLSVRVLQNGQPRTVTRVAAPGPGRIGVVRTRVAVPDSSGPAVFTAELVGNDGAGGRADAFAGDDRRSAVVRVDPEEGGLVLVSFSSDWESRFLLPVLEQVTGLPTRGYVRLADGRFLLQGAAGGVAEADEVRRRAERAEFLVVHGARGGLDVWVEDAARAAGRVILFTEDAESAAWAGLVTGDRRGGEWYGSTDALPSVLAGTLVDVPWATLPPLTAVLPLTDAGRADIPLPVQFQGSGTAEAALALARSADRRQAVVLARGFWRWAFRPGVAREAYRRLWSAVGGWLLVNEPLAAAGRVGPERSVNMALRPVEWRANGFEGRRLRVRVTDAGGAAVDTTVAIIGGTFQTAGLPPGVHSYEVWGADESTAGTDGTSGTEALVGSGTVVSESYSSDMARPVAAPASADDAEASGDPGTRPGRPLRLHPLPYLMLLALLAAEWILRRRRGLR